MKCHYKVTQSLAVHCCSGGAECVILQPYHGLHHALASWANHTWPLDPVWRGTHTGTSMHLTMASGLFSRCSPILYMYALQLAETGWNTLETTDVILTSLSVCMPLIPHAQWAHIAANDRRKERKFVDLWANQSATPTGMGANPITEKMGRNVYPRTSTVTGSMTNVSKNKSSYVRPKDLSSVWQACHASQTSRGL